MLLSHFLQFWSHWSERRYKYLPLPVTPDSCKTVKTVPMCNLIDLLLFSSQLQEFACPFFSRRVKLVTCNKLTWLSQDNTCVLLTSSGNTFAPEPLRFRCLLPPLRSGGEQGGAWHRGHPARHRELTSVRRQHSLAPACNNNTALLNCYQ